MVAQLVRQDDGSYDYVEVDTAPKKAVTSNVAEFEAYEGAKKGGEELVSGPSITEQTKSLQREIPGQVEFDEKTGQFITKKAKTVDLEYKEPERTPESTEMTALEKVMSMPSQTQTTDTGLERAYSLIERQQKLAEQQQKFQNYAQLARTGVDVYNIATGKDLIPLKFKGTSFTSMPIGKGTVGGVGTAGMIGYGVSGLLGGEAKQQKKAGVGSAIGMAVGGPVGGVVGGVIGHVVGGKVVCTMMNEAYGFGSFRSAIWLKYAKDNLTKEHEIGYHIIFIPLVNYAKQKGFLNNIIKKILEHIAIHRTIDIRKETRNKIHLLGRIYRKILEPICYTVGRIKSWQ